MFYCDTMWVVGQADDFFVCFGAKPNKGMSPRSPTRPEVREERQVREKPGGAGKGNQRERELAKEPREGQLENEPREGELAKKDAERQSRPDSRRDQSR